MASLADGDLLCVPTLASLARSAGELSKILSVLAGRGVELWVAGRRFADLTPTETVDMVATMASDLRREAETLDARKSEETERRRGGQYLLSAVEALELREAWDAGGGTAREVAAQHGVSRATLFRAVGPTVFGR